MRNRAGGLLIKNGKILLIHRIKNINGERKEYYVVPGGGIEEKENIKEATIRELKEETGLTLTSYRFRGLVTFISNECEPELMCVFTADGFTGELIECDEGELAWVDKEEVPELPTWEGDRVFLNLLLSGEERFFSIKLKYEGSRLVEKQVNLY